MKKEKSSLVFALVAVLFCISGVSALTYQVAWQRILALHTGIGVYSVAIIVAVFMAGLGIGSHFGGVISKKVNRKRALFLFGSFELGIGLFAFISCWLYYDILYFKAPNLYNNLLIGTLSHFLSLVVPTFLMGASLPFLVRAMIDKVEKAQVRISYLYGINVVGACIGAIITPWIYIRFFGIREAVIFAGVGNLFTGISAFIIWYIYGNKLVENREDNKKSVIINTKSFESKPFSLWFVLYALSGFIALSLEVLWFRILDVSVKSTAFTFGTMLAIYLFGLALGSIIGAHLVPKIKNLLKAFLTVQCIILLYSALFVILLVYLPKDFPVYRWFYNYWGEYVKYFKLGMTSVSSQFVMLYLVFPLFLYAVPTILMGFSFAILQQSIQHDKESCSLKVGMLQAANIAGCTAGSLIIGLLSINLWGTIGSLRFLMIMGFIFLVIGFKHYKYQNVFLVLLVLMVLFIIFLPSQNAFWQRLHGRMGENALIEEDAAGIISITYHDPDWWMTVNGLRHSKFPYSIDQMHTLLGAIPSILHDSPKDIALIGLGSGNTAWSSGCRPMTTNIVVYEICSQELNLLKKFNTMVDFPKLRAFLTDRRYKVLTVDGRNSLARNEHSFDIIEADPLRPYSSYSGNLYSIEFFKLCSSKLNKNGIMCTWSPTDRIRKSFLKVFPYVLSFNGGNILTGSNQPITVNKNLWNEILKEPHMLSYFDATTLKRIKKVMKTMEIGQKKSIGEKASSFNHDLYPRDEYQTP